MQIARILRDVASRRVIDSMSESVGSEERQTAREASLKTRQQGVIDRISRTLKQGNCAICGQRPARLDRRLQQTRYGKSLVDIDGLYEFRPFVSDVTDLKEHFRKQLPLISNVPMLDIRVAKIGINRGHIVNLRCRRSRGSERIRESQVAGKSARVESFRLLKWGASADEE
jgi:hypothetical protein